MRNRIRRTPTSPGGLDWEPGRRWALIASRSAGSVRTALHARANDEPATSTNFPANVLANLPGDDAGARWRRTLQQA